MKSATNQHLSFDSIIELMENGSEHLFITGRAGTGKSTLLKRFRAATKRSLVALAPTGVAAVNIAGQTIHSFFGFKPSVTLSQVRKVEEDELYRALEIIVIDEISMVRADLLDCVDKFLRLNGPSRTAPFGGVKMIFIGDLFQLPPVVTDRDQEMLKGRYDTPYFFSARALQPLTGFTMRTIELSRIFRQNDHIFIDLLNAVRSNTATDDHFRLLNDRHDPDFMPDSDRPPVYLCTTNALAKNINDQCLKELTDDPRSFIGRVAGDFDAKSFPTDEVLELKVGARVMLLNNDVQNRWVNGTLGTVVSFEDGSDRSCVVMVEIDGGGVVSVMPHEWDQYEFVIDPDAHAVESQAVGSFTQYPLKLAWAITIHKSQGQTFDNVMIDIGFGTFAHGQLYVALSRCRTLEGLRLKRPLLPRHIQVDSSVVNFIASLHPEHV